ncbi:MAG: hypothetical protein JJE18_08720 [Eubacteriaceae bacterium]|nr:hypothetical protein [Eubacteriaceae bacterium]
MKCDICQINEADDQTPDGGNFCFICENKFMEAMDDGNKMKDYLEAMSDEKKMDAFITAFLGVKRID